MRKVILMLCLMAAMCAGSASAQGKHFAIEFGAGMNFGLADLGKDKFSGNKSSADLYAELRYSIKQSPFEVGLYVGENLLLRESLRGNNYDFFSTNIMLTSNYNHVLNDKFTLFGGVGVGMCTIDSSADIEIEGSDMFSEAYSDNGPSGSFAFMPRVGVQFWKLRLTMGYKFQEKANRHAFATLGFSFRF